MNYRSVMHTTCNEDGEYEVEIVYERGFFRRLLGYPELRQVYVKRDGTPWRCKLTGTRASPRKVLEISDLLLAGQRIKLTAME